MVLWCILAPVSRAADDRDNDAWSQLTAQNPFTVDPAMPHGFLQLPSTDTTPFYIRYNKDIYFTIPRNYLLQLTNIRYGHGAPEVVFSAEMLYPSFAGATTETLQQFDFRSWTQSPDIIRIVGPFHDNGHSNTNILSKEHDTEQHEVEYGLMKVTHHPIGMVADAYFSNDPELGPVVIVCTPPNSDGLPICNVQVNITDAYKLTYQYHRDLLPEWRQIHERVLDFINSSLRKG